MGVFEGMLLMRVTTVDGVTTQNGFSEKNIDESSYYEVYSIATSSFTIPRTITIPLIHSISTASNKTQNPTLTDHLPETTTSLDASSYYTPHSSTTSSFTPRYALAISPPHSKSTTGNEMQQPMRTHLLPHHRF